MARNKKRPQKGGKKTGGGNGSSWNTVTRAPTPYEKMFGTGARPQRGAPVQTGSSRGGKKKRR